MAVHNFTIMIESDEQGFHAYVPALPGCHTFADTIDEAHSNILEALELHCQSLFEDGESVPVEDEPVFITRLSVPVGV